MVIINQSIILWKHHVNLLSQSFRPFIKKRAKMFGFSELWDFLDILGRYYNTIYVQKH